MFGIKVKNEFLDLGQSAFDIILKSPFYFDTADSEILRGSVLLSFKAPLTKHNKRILGSPQNLTNPNFFLENVAEVWSNGSQLYEGPFKVTESTGNEATISVSINSFLSIKDAYLKDLNLDNIEGDNLIAQWFNGTNSFNFRCPTILNFNQTINEYNYNLTPDINKALINYFTRDNLGYPDVLGDRSQITAMPLMSHIWQKIFDYINKDVEVPFKNNAELSELILYSTFPTVQAGRSRGNVFDQVNLKRSVPQKLKIGDFVKHFCRLFNKGLQLENLNGNNGFIDAELQIENTEGVMDWTSKVKKEYQIKENEVYIDKYKRTKTDYTGYLQASDEKRFYFETGCYEYNFDTKTGYYKAGNQRHFVRPLNFTGNPQSYFWRGYHYMVHEDEVMLPQPPFKTSEFEFKALTLPQTHANWHYQDKICNCPLSNQRNSTEEGNEEDKMTLLLYRGKNFGLPLASSETETIAHADTGTVLNVNPFKIGDAPTSGVDNRPNAQYSLQIEGEKGIVNTFHKKWAAFLAKKREVEFNLNLSIRDLRNFTFSKNVYIGNQLYLVRELHVKFGVNGIESAKAIMVQL